MLTSLNQLVTGKPWPPNDEIAKRMHKLESYKKLFAGEHGSVYEDQYKRISRVIGNFDEVCCYGITLNYQKKISIKTADLLIGELPTITTATQTKQPDVDLLIENTDFWNTIYQSILDVSRYGDSVLVVYQDTNKAQIDVVPTQYWIPIVDPNNIKKIMNHVIVWTYKEGKYTYLKVQIHSKGSYVVRVYEIEKDQLMPAMTKIGRLVSEEEFQTGLDDFAVVTLSNITSSDSIYGISDYEDVDSIISEIEIRVAQISKILDKHADPSMQVPGCVIDVDPETGQSKLKLGNAFIIDSKDAVEPKYITWDGQLESNFKMIQLLLDQLGIMSELGNLFLGNGIEKLGNISGVALKKLAFSALAKSNRLQMRIGPAIIKTLKLASQLNTKGVSNLSKEKVSITFGDGLPSDWTEIIDYLSKAVDSKIMSQETAIIKMNDNITDKEVAEEIARINAMPEKTEPPEDNMDGNKE